uniref:Uncharacterized protein n=1 Tax=Oryza meridionalis TaxID=40149 RepID=A0A0E0CJ00_9ORYZ
MAEEIKVVEGKEDSRFLDVSLASLSPGAAREVVTWPPLFPTSLLRLAVARAAAGKATRLQGRRRRGSPRLLALRQFGEPPGAATVVTARSAPFRPDLAEWLMAVGTTTAAGTGDGGGRDELRQVELWVMAAGMATAMGRRRWSLRIRLRHGGRRWAVHAGIPRLPLAFSSTPLGVGRRWW